MNLWLGAIITLLLGTLNLLFLGVRMDVRDLRNTMTTHLRDHGNR